MHICYQKIEIKLHPATQLKIPFQVKQLLFRHEPLDRQSFLKVRESEEYLKLPIFIYVHGVQISREILLLRLHLEGGSSSLGPWRCPYKYLTKICSTFKNIYCLKSDYFYLTR